ncbi:MAG: hypothetical protein ACR2NO_02875 [Chloroflexota bacterium]
MTDNATAEVRREATQLSPEQIRVIAAELAGARDRLPEPVRSGMGRGLRISGFERDSLRAPTNLFRAALEREFQRSSKVHDFLLRTFLYLHQPVANRVREVLDGQPEGAPLLSLDQVAADVAARHPDVPGSMVELCILAETRLNGWRAESNAAAAAHQKSEAPIPDCESPSDDAERPEPVPPQRLVAWLGELRSLAVDAVEWDHLDWFADELRDLADSHAGTIAENARAAQQHGESVAAALAAVLEEGDTWRALGLGCDRWDSESCPTEVLSETADSLLVLGEALAAHRKTSLAPPGVSQLVERRAWRARRGELEDEIAARFAELDALLAATSDEWADQDEGKSAVAGTASEVPASARPRPLAPAGAVADVDETPTSGQASSDYSSGAPSPTTPVDLVTVDEAPPAAEPTPPPSPVASSVLIPASAGPGGSAEIAAAPEFDAASSQPSRPGPALTASGARPGATISRAIPDQALSTAPPHPSAFTRPRTGRLTDIARDERTPGAGEPAAPSKGVTPDGQGRVAESESAVDTIADAARMWAGKWETLPRAYLAACWLKQTGAAFPVHPAVLRLAHVALRPERPTDVERVAEAWEAVERDGSVGGRSTSGDLGDLRGPGPARRPPYDGSVLSRYRLDRRRVRPTAPDGGGAHGVLAPDERAPRSRAPAYRCRAGRSR